MEKRLEKLKKAVDKLQTALDKVLNSSTKITDHKEFLENKINRLREKNIELIGELDNINFVNNNIESWKNKTIKHTVFGLYILVFCLILINLNGVNLVPTVLALLAGVPLSIALGECGDYYNNKRYLKHHTKENVEKQISENEKTIELTKEKLSTILNELDLLLEDETLLKTEIEKRKNEISNIFSLMNKEKLEQEKENCNYRVSISVKK